MQPVKINYEMILKGLEIMKIIDNHYEENEESNKDTIKYMDTYASKNVCEIMEEDLTKESFKKIKNDLVDGYLKAVHLKLSKINMREEIHSIVFLNKIYADCAKAYLMKIKILYACRNL